MSRSRPPEGKLGVLIPGMGAVTTTFIAGVEAIKAGWASRSARSPRWPPSGSGKRTDGRSPKIKDFVPLAGLNDLVIGGWDIFEDNAYEAAMKAGVLEADAAREGEGAALRHQADEGGLRPGIRAAHQRAEREAGRVQDGQGPAW